MLGIGGASRLKSSNSCIESKQRKKTAMQNGFQHPQALDAPGASNGASSVGAQDRRLLGTSTEHTGGNYDCLNDLPRYLPE